MAADRKPPESVEAESRLLSCILLDGASSMTKCLTRDVSERTFYQPKNRIIFQRLVAMVAANLPIDLASLSEEMMLAKEIETVGGMEYLMQISGFIPTTAQADYFIDKLKELQTLREVLREAQVIVESCYSYKGGGIGETLEKPVMKLLDVASGGSGKQDKTWVQVISDAEKITDSIIDNQGLPPERLIHFPFEEMDQLFGPIERGSLVLLGGLPSSGKSSFARMMVTTNARNGHDCYVDTLEVRPARVALNMAQSMSRIGLKVLGKAHQRDQVDFRRVLHDLSGLGIHISDKDKTLNQVLAHTRALQSKKPLGLIVIDHGLLLHDIANCKHTEKEGAIGRVTAMLKDLATDLDAAVLLLWQLNRSPGKDGREIRVSDLKGSGDIEANADKVLIVERPAENPVSKQSQVGNTHVADMPVYYQHIVQGKGRDDGVATFALEFERAIATFREILPEDPNETPATQQDIGI